MVRVSASRPLVPSPPAAPPAKARVRYSNNRKSRQFARASHSVLTIAAWHSLAWLYVANLIGVRLAVSLLYPRPAAGERSYGRWTPVHLNFQLTHALPFHSSPGRSRSTTPITPTWRPDARGTDLMVNGALQRGLPRLQGDSSGNCLDWSAYVWVFSPLPSSLYGWCSRLPTRATGRPRTIDPLPFGPPKSLDSRCCCWFSPVIYIASSPAIYPAVNPDSGGPTGASRPSPR